MRQCRECGQEFLDGALFCSECGTYLLEDEEGLLTLEMPIGKAPAAERPTRPLDYRLGFGIKADRIMFVIPSSGRRLEIEIGDEIAIGRVDSRHGIWPEVDLTLDDGAESGVSRRHALVRNSDEGVVLVDLGSTNGTRVNERLLAPERPYLLSNGDSVRFGRLLVQIYFET